MSHLVLISPETNGFPTINYNVHNHFSMWINHYILIFLSPAFFSLLMQLSHNSDNFSPSVPFRIVSIVRY